MTFSETDIQRDTSGRFAEKLGGSPEVTLAKPVFEERFAGSVRAGDVVHLEGSNTESPFQFAFFHNREYRKTLKAAGYPDELTVISAGRAAEDGRTDNDITFDIGGEPFTLSFHRERQMLVSTPAEMCGDYPAPCNCDDPVTHNGH